MIHFEQNCNKLKMAAIGRNMQLIFAIKYHHKFILPQLGYRDWYLPHHLFRKTYSNFCTEVTNKTNTQPATSSDISIRKPRSLYGVTSLSSNVTLETKVKTLFKTADGLFAVRGCTNIRSRCKVYDRTEHRVSQAGSIRKPGRAV